MSFSKVHSGQINFLSGQIIDIEIDLSKGLHAFSIVGLPDKAVEEARDRISAAIKNSGFKSPKYKNQKVVISLAPAHVRKEGPAFDLAMAMGYLLAAEDIRFDPRRKIFLGELSLDGRLRPITGCLAIVTEAKRAGFTEIFLPKENAAEAALISGVSVFGAENFIEVIAHLNEKKSRDIFLSRITPKKIIEKTCVENLAGHQIDESADEISERNVDNDEVRLEDIRGQETAKRAIEIAGAGGHNILLTGPPGTGKTMIAKALRQLLPKLSSDESLEVTSIHSIAGILKKSRQGNTYEPSSSDAPETPPIVRFPPFRSPHHTSSYVSLIGGGSAPRPGEMTLAHRGLLFLDELPEFDRRVIEALRQPLEDRKISLSRLRGSVTFPAHFILVAAMNPCPCGYRGSKKKECTCTSRDQARYGKKISGPILDRIDLRVEVGDIEFENESESESEITRASDSTTRKDSGELRSETDLARERIVKARFLQFDRLKNFVMENGGQPINSYIAGKNLDKFAPISHNGRRKLLESSAKLGFSMRAYHRVWRVARTIADLAGSREIEEAHIFEALQFRGIE